MQAAECYVNSVPKAMRLREETTVELSAFTDYGQKIRANCSRVIVGKEDVIEKDSGLLYLFRPSAAGG